LRILVDTNILISALFYPKSIPSKALYHAADNHVLVLSDHNIAEFRRIARDKFSSTQADIDLFLTELPNELVLAPEAPQKLIADPKDAPILNAAIISDVDIIISRFRAPITKMFLFKMNLIGSSTRLPRQ
jgi:putative PIN family toxin of toxin-antitoxin system